MADGQKTAAARKGPGWFVWLVPVGVIAFFAFDQFVLTRLTQPERHAERTPCIGPYDGEPAWQNTCEETLNFRYCLLAGPEREVCRVHKLAPGEGVSDVSIALAALGGGLTGMTRMACAEPYSVMQKPHPNNGRIQDVCG